MRRAGTGLICAAAWCPTIPGAMPMFIARPASVRRSTSFRWAPTVRKAAVVRQPTSSAARSRRGGSASGAPGSTRRAPDSAGFALIEILCVRARGRSAGFALIEILCVLAIIGLLAAIILPAVPRSTTRAKLESYAVETAALLKADRTAALRRQIQVATQVDAEARSIRSGVTGRAIGFPADVVIDTYLASRCADRSAGRSIDFFPSGMSCGGTIALARPGMGYEVRVNWLTGGVEIVPKKLL